MNAAFMQRRLFRCPRRLDQARFGVRRAVIGRPDFKHQLHADGRLGLHGVGQAVFLNAQRGQHAGNVGIVSAQEAGV